MRIVPVPMTMEMMEDAIISIEAQRLVDAVCAEMLEQFAEDCDRRMEESIGRTEKKPCSTPGM